jgi:hypothetical protein
VGGEVAGGAAGAGSNGGGRAWRRRRGGGISGAAASPGFNGWRRPRPRGLPAFAKHAAARCLADTRTRWWNCGGKLEERTAATREDGNRIITLQETKCRTNTEAKNREKSCKVKAVER